MLNIIVTSYCFYFFRETSLNFVIYDVVSLSQPGKSLIVSQKGRNIIIFQANRRRNTYFLNIVLKERPGFGDPSFVLNFHIFQPYCSHISVLIFACTYFGLIFWDIRKLTLANNIRFFIRVSFDHFEIFSIGKKCKCLKTIYLPG